MESTVQAKGKPLVNVLLVLFQFFYIIFWMAVIVTTLMILSSITSFNGLVIFPKTFEFPVLVASNLQQETINWTTELSGLGRITNGAAILQVEGVPGKFLFFVQPYYDD